MDDSARRYYRQQLQRLQQATRYLNKPEELAEDVNRWIIKNQPEIPRTIVEARFKSEGGSSGAGRWKPLALRTAVQRRMQGFGDFNPILCRSGLLMRAAVGGKMTATPRSITMEFKDGPAPVYTGKGAYKKKRRKFFVADNGQLHRVKKKDFNLFRGEKATEGLATHSVGSLSDYAEELNEDRPFYGAPTEQELAPLKELGRAVLVRALAAIQAGHDPEL